MESVSLRKGKCPICGNSYPESWSSSLTLGVTCEAHSDQRDQVFKPENVDFSAAKNKFHFNPLTGAYSTRYDWSGTKVMVNGRVGTVGYVQADACIVRYNPVDQPRDEDWLALGYYGFLRLYKAAGLEVALPPLEFTEPDLVRADLLPEPVFPLDVHYNQEGQICGVEVSGVYLPSEGLTAFHLIHQFCNLYVKDFFELEASFSAEGGFEGDGIEVRNLYQRVGIMEYYHRPRTDMQMKHNQHVFQLWIEMCRILLRQPWDETPFTSVAEIWAAFVKLQALALNQMTGHHLKALLATCRAYSGNPFNPRI